MASRHPVGTRNGEFGDRCPALPCSSPPPHDRAPRPGPADRAQGRHQRLNDVNATTGRSEQLRRRRADRRDLVQCGNDCGPKRDRIVVGFLARNPRHARAEAFGPLCEQCRLAVSRRCDDGDQRLIRGRSVDRAAWFGRPRRRESLAPGTWAPTPRLLTPPRIFALCPIGQSRLLKPALALCRNYLVPGGCFNELQATAR